MMSIVLITTVTLIAVALAAYYVISRVKKGRKPKLEAMREWPC